MVIHVVRKTPALDDDAFLLGWILTRSPGIGKAGEMPIACCGLPLFLGLLDFGAL